MSQVDYFRSHSYRLIYLSNMLILFVSVPNQEISDTYPYSNNIRAASVSDNIRIRIRIRFENMKMKVVRALSDPHPIRFHP